MRGEQQPSSLDIEQQVADLAGDIMTRNLLALRRGEGRDGSALSAFEAMAAAGVYSPGGPALPEDLMLPEDSRQEPNSRQQDL